MSELISNRKIAPFANITGHSTGTPQLLMREALWKQNSGPESPYGEYSVFDLTALIDQRPTEPYQRAYHFGSAYILEEHASFNNSKFWILHFKPLGATSVDRLGKLIEFTELVLPDLSHSAIFDDIVQRDRLVFGKWREFTHQDLSKTADMKWITTTVPQLIQEALRDNVSIKEIAKVITLDGMEHDFSNFPPIAETIYIQPTENMINSLGGEDNETEWLPLTEPAIELPEIHEALKVAILQV